MIIRNTNDVLALILLLLIPALWVANGKWIVLPGEVMGALIATWTMIITYYFRKKPPDKRVKDAEKTV